MQHEMEVAAAAGALGSMDANTGDLLLGWDTDQFPTDIYLTTQCMLTMLLKAWAASPPAARTSTPRCAARVLNRSILFHAHIGGMDAFARGLKIAAAIRKDGRLADSFVKQRYSSWDSKASVRDIEKAQGRLQGTV